MQDGETDFANTPNLLTLSRILLVPVVVGLLFISESWAGISAAIIFGIAGATDYFDGYFARKMGLVSIYGKLMDPLADKFLVVSSLLMLQHLDRVHPVIVILLVCREFAVTGLRALASAEGVVIDASAGAKWKTGTQMVAIPVLMVPKWWLGLPFDMLGKFLLLVSLFISLWSMHDYVFNFFRALRRRRLLRREKKKPSLR